MFTLAGKASASEGYRFYKGPGLQQGIRSDGHQAVERPSGDGLLDGPRGQVVHLHASGR